MMTSLSSAEPEEREHLFGDRHLLWVVTNSKAVGLTAAAVFTGNVESRLQQAPPSQHGHSLFGTG